MSKHKQNQTPPSPEEIRECLERSGYLLESKIVRQLSEGGFFVEPSQVIKDPFTGKSREIDLIAEHNGYSPSRREARVKSHFVMEVSNNLYPFVLLTKRPFSPGASYESYVKSISTPNPSPFFGKVEAEGVKYPESDLIFSQYCVLTRKSGSGNELMASHTDDMYGSLFKLSEYVESEIQKWLDPTESSSDYWRLFYWNPMVVLGGKLLCVTAASNEEPEIREIERGFLEFNWHRGEQQMTTVIEVITERALYERLQQVVEQDCKLEMELAEIRADIEIGL